MTKTDWTAEEVRAQAKLERRDRGDVVTEAMLTAFAERIEEDESAVPVAWVRPSAEGYDSSFRDAITVMACPEGSWAKDGWIPLYTHPQAQPAQETPCSLNEAMNVIENWGRRGNTLSGDDVSRFRALADKIAPAQEQPGWKLPEKKTSLQYQDARYRNEAIGYRDGWNECCDAMLAASPTPPKEN